MVTIVSVAGSGEGFRYSRLPSPRHKKAATELNDSSSFPLSGTLRNRFGASPRELLAADHRENGIYRGAFSLREERNAEGERPVR